MKRLKIELDLQNDAFQPHPGDEIARILRETADKLAQGVTASSGFLRDANGNRVGTWEVKS